MRILYISSRFPMPANAGREGMILQTMEKLSTMGTLDVLYFDRTDVAVDRLNLLSTKISGRVLGCLNLPGFLTILSNILFFWRGSFQNSMYFDRRNLNKMQSMLDSSGYDYIFYDMLRVGQYKSWLKSDASHVLEMDDLLSKRYRRMSSGGFVGSSPLGTYSSKYRFFDIFFKYFGFKVLLKIIFQIESDLIRKLEISSPREFDFVTCTSPLEVADLMRITGGSNIVANPPLFESMPIEGSCRALDSSGVPYVLFVGNLNSLHNRQSLINIVENILPFWNPAINERFVFKIVGKMPDDIVLPEFVNEGVKIEVHGFVNDLASLYKDAAAVFCPLVFGSGIKIKVVEAMAHSVPVISNSIGFEGIPVVDGVHCLLSESPKELLANIDRLLNSAHLRESIVEQARELVADNFSHKILPQGLFSIFSTGGNRVRA